jgi:hypothetical protein
VAPVAPVGPGALAIVTISCAGWLVAVFSFVSSRTAVPPVPVISRPRLLAGFEIHACTSLVTLTSTTVFAVVTPVKAKGVPAVVGWVFQVTRLSVQGEVTSVKFSVPAELT